MRLHGVNAWRSSSIPKTHLFSVVYGRHWKSNALRSRVHLWSGVARFDGGRVAPTNTEAVRSHSDSPCVVDRRRSGRLGLCDALSLAVLCGLAADELFHGDAPTRPSVSTQRAVCARLGLHLEPLHDGSALGCRAQHGAEFERGHGRWRGRASRGAGRQRTLRSRSALALHQKEQGKRAEHVHDQRDAEPQLERR